MTETLTDPPPTACTLGATDLRDRLAWIADLDAAALRSSRREGLRLVLTYAPVALERVRDLAAREKACCAFLTFETEVRPHEVILTITTPETAPDAAEAVFAAFASPARQPSGCACCAGGAA